MADLRSGPPQWPLPVPSTDQSRRSPYVPRQAAHTGTPAAAAPPGTAARPRRPAPRHATGEWRTVSARTASPPPTGRSRRRSRRLDANPWHWLLLIPIVVPLVPTLYNHIEPKFMGLPFFYWGQLAFAFLSSAVIAFVHRKVR